MPRRRLDDEEKERLSARRYRIGSILREMRRSAGLPRTFAEPLVSDAMVGMIEAGLSPLPSEIAYEYADALNVNGNYVSPDQLILAYASIRRTKSDERFPWQSWKTLPDEVAAHHLRGELKKPLANPDTAKSSEPEFSALTTIQLQMVKDIAKAVGRFGSRIVTEEALVAWEDANSAEIINLRAAVPCLESELTPQYIESMKKMAAHDNFRKFQYVIATSSGSLPPEWRTLKRELALPSDKLPDPVLIRAADFNKITYKITSLARALGSSDSKYRSPDKNNRSSDWDAFYYYEMKLNPRGGLMFGVFRRLSQSKSKAHDITLRQWGAEPINETLPWPCIEEFEELHNALWTRHHPPGAS